MSKVLTKTVREGTAGEDSPILVAAGPNVRGRRALRRGCMLASDLGRKVFGFRVLEEDAFVTTGEISAEELARDLEAADEGLTAPAAAIVACYPDHYMDDEFGRAVCIVDAASARGAGLIVLGLTNIKETKRTFSATATRQLIPHAPCPVLIAANEPPARYAKVMVAIDFSPVSLAAVRGAMELAPDAELHLVHVTEKGAEKKDRDALHHLVAEAGGTQGAEDIVPHIMGGATTKALEKALKEIEPDLLVFGTKGRTGLARMLLGSIAARFIEEPPCDLLVLRSPQA